MNSSVFESAMQAATRSTAVASAIESTSLRHIAKSMSVASQFERHAKQLSQGVTMPQAAPGLSVFGQVCGSADAAGRLAREELDRITELQRTLTPDVASNYADMADQAVPRRASNQLTVGARDAAAQIDAVVGPRALIDSCRLQALESVLPTMNIRSITGSREADPLGELLDDRCDEDITLARPIIFDSPGMRRLQREQVSASDLTEPRRSDIGHRHVVVVERALRHFICQYMQKAFGENWLAEKVPGPLRKKWMARQKSRGARASGLHLIEFADFGIYAELITGVDEVWSRAFEPVLRDKKAIVWLLGELNPYRRDTSHSRELSPDDLVVVHCAAVMLLMLIAPDAVDDLPASILFVS